MGSKYSNKKLGVVPTTALKGSKAVMISCFILEDEQRTFQHTVVCDTSFRYKTCHTPDVIIETNLTVYYVVDRTKTSGIN